MDAARGLTISTLRRTLAATSALAMLLGASALRGQTAQTGSVTGYVLLSDGRPVANATVSVRQADGSYPRRTTTDDRGAFRLYFVPPGRYELTARLIGFRPVTLQGVAVRAAEARDVRVVVEPSRPELSALTVTSSPVAIHTGSTEFSSSLTAAERELLPAPRDANALIAFTPGARPEQVYGGSTGQANVYQLDGVSVNQPGFGGSFLLPNVDWIEDFTVVGPGAGAEHGNFQGGLINIVTKSGSNTRRSQLRTFVEDRRLNASNRNAFGAGAELGNRTEVNAEWGGPVIRDRLYYYVSAQDARAQTRIIDQRTATVAAPSWLPVQAERHERKLYGKLTWQPSNGDMLQASAGVDIVNRERVGLSAFTAADATYRGRSPSVFAQANWQRTLSPRRFLELKVSGYAGRDDELPYNGSDRPAVVLLDAPNAPLFANAYYTRRNTPRSLGVTALHDWHLDVGRWQHHLKFGAEYVSGTWREQRSRNADMTWYTEGGDNFDPLDPATWREIPSLGVYATADTGGRIDLNADSHNAALFVQDYLRLSRHVTVSAGVRVGQWIGTLTPGFGGRNGAAERFEAVRATGIDPRVGVVYDLGGNARTVVKAHWGRFHQNLFALFYDRAPGANIFTNIDYCDWNDVAKQRLPSLTTRYSAAEFDALFTCYPGAVLSNEAQAIERYRQPYMDQLTLGVERAVGTRVKVTLLYLARRNRAVLSLVDANLERNWSPISNVRVRDARGPVTGADGASVVLPLLYVRNDALRDRLRAGDVVPGYTRADTARLAFNPRPILTTVDDASRAFDQLQLMVQGVWPRLTVHASVARTILTGNVFSVNGYVDPNGQGNGPFIDPNGQLNFGGRLANSAPWDVRLRLSGRLPWGMEGGAFASWTSGDAWTPQLTITRQLGLDAESATGAVPLDARLVSGTVGQTLFIEPRGSRQLPAQLTVNLRLQRATAVRGHTLIVGIEAFNMLNGSAVTSVRETLNGQDASDPSTLVGAVRLRQQPATLRLNVQYRR